MMFRFPEARRLRFKRKLSTSRDSIPHSDAEARLATQVCSMDVTQTCLGPRLVCIASSLTDALLQILKRLESSPAVGDRFNHLLLENVGVSPETRRANVLQSVYLLADGYLLNNGTAFNGHMSHLSELASLGVLAGLPMAVDVYADFCANQINIGGCVIFKSIIKQAAHNVRNPFAAGPDSDMSGDCFQVLQSSLSKFKDSKGPASVCISNANETDCHSSLVPRAPFEGVEEAQRHGH